MTAVVTITEVTKLYGPRKAVDDVSLTLGFGEKLALLGPNGAGKTSLIKMILGLTRPNSGHIDILGSRPGSKIARQACAYLPENVAFHGSLTGWEQLSEFARLKGETSKTAAELLERVGLGDAMSARIATYSKGMRQKLGLAQLLIGPPRIAILDEPTSGLDPLARETFYQLLADLAANGTAVLLSSHALTEIEARTDRIAILNNGRLIACDHLCGLRNSAGLPVRMRVAVKAGCVDKIARQLGGRPVNGRSIELTCNAESKLSMLSEIVLFGAQVEDVELAPPSLEDIYRHLSAEKLESEVL